MKRKPKNNGKHSGILHRQSISSELHNLALELVMEIEQGSVSDICGNRESANCLESGKSKSSPKQLPNCLQVS